MKKSVELHGDYSCGICREDFKDKETKYECDDCVRSYHLQCMNANVFVKHGKRQVVNDDNVSEDGENVDSASDEQNSTYST